MKIETRMLYLGIIIGLLIGLLSGLFISAKAEIEMMGEYDLYNCIYNNADSNRFNQNPIMAKKIQDECICFRENNYTNLLEVDCSQLTVSKEENK